MTRLYGWGEKSERVNDYVPDVRFERSSIIATIGIDGINAPMTFKGTLNSDVFRPYIEQFLAPTLEEGDIVIMDNCSVHKVKGILDPIYAITIRFNQLVASSTARWFLEIILTSSATAAAVTAMIVDMPTNFP